MVMNITGDMRKCKIEISLFIFFGFVSWHCKEIYLPPAISTPANYLVVDGFINTGADSTIIKLTRTRNIGSGTQEIVELNAVVQVQDEMSNIYPLTERGKGIYARAAMPLKQGQYCRLKIATRNGSSYTSEPILIQKTPPIDSITWSRDEAGVHIYANTHDPSNNSRFYQWEYTETWEYRTQEESEFKYVNGTVIKRDSVDQIYRCWTTANSNQYILGSTQHLSDDIVSNFNLLMIPPATVRLSLLYSILVKQHVLTKEGFEYWENFAKITEGLGSIFDTQPSQLTGNIRCNNNPDEPVIGFINAYQVETKRIFIDNNDLPQWNYYKFPFPKPCKPYQLRTIGVTITDFFGNGSTLVPMSPGEGVPIECADCRVQGGKTLKPSFWP